MRLYTLLALALLAAPVALTSCASDTSINQLPAPARATVEREVGSAGVIKDIDVESHDGILYYEVEYKKGNESFEMNVTEDGKIQKKDED